MPEKLESNSDAHARVANPGVSDDELPSKTIWPATREVLQAPLHVSGEMPDPYEFVPMVAGSLLQGADMANTVLPGARQQIDYLLAQGDKVAIWSAGHLEHQLRKIGGVGLYNAVDAEGIIPPVVVSAVRGDPLEVKTVIAADKTTPAVLARVREIADGNQVAVIDDRASNLLAFREDVPETKAALWAQFGAHAHREMDNSKRGASTKLETAIANGFVTPLSSIALLGAKIDELRATGIIGPEPLVLFADCDGNFLCDNAKRRSLEFNAVVTGNSVDEGGYEQNSVRRYVAV